jgi:methyl-accepting chemotaxis protein
VFSSYNAFKIKTSSSPKKTKKSVLFEADKNFEKSKIDVGVKKILIRLKELRNLSEIIILQIKTKKNRLRKCISAINDYCNDLTTSKLSLSIDFSANNNKFKIFADELSRLENEVVKFCEKLDNLKNNIIDDFSRYECGNVNIICFILNSCQYFNFGKCIFDFKIKINTIRADFDEIINNTIKIIYDELVTFTQDGLSKDEIYQANYEILWMSLKQ